MSIKQMSLVWEHEFSHQEQAIMLALADHAHDDGTQVRPSIDRIAWKTGYSPRSVQRIIKGLHKSGVLILTEPATNRTPNVYAINWGSAKPKLEFSEWKQVNKSEETGGDKLSPQVFHRGDNLSPPGGSRGDKLSTLGVTNRVSRGDKSSTLGVTQLCHPNHHINHKRTIKEEPNKRARARDDFFSTGPEETHAPLNTLILSRKSEGHHSLGVLAEHNISPSYQAQCPNAQLPTSEGEGVPPPLVRQYQNNFQGLDGWLLRVYQAVQETIPAHWVRYGGLTLPGGAIDQIDALLGRYHPDQIEQFFWDAAFFQLHDEFFVRQVGKTLMDLLRPRDGTCWLEEWGQKGAHLRSLPEGIRSEGQIKQAIAGRKAEQIKAQVREELGL